MKKILSLIMLFVLCFSCKENKTNTGEIEEVYTINGNLKGVVEGVEITLKLQSPDYFNNGTEISKTTILKKGGFQFIGKTNKPALYFITVEDTIKKRGDRLTIPLFLENSTINIEAKENEIATLNAIRSSKYDYQNIKIEGSKSHVQYVDFQSNLAPITKETAALWEENTKNWKEKKKLTIDEGINLASRFEVNSDKKKEYIFNFTKNNFNNSVGQYTAYCAMKFIGVKFSKDQFYRLLSLDTDDVNPILLNEIKEYSRVSVGADYVDLTFVNSKNKLVKLSSLIEKNKYTLVEFWASWCGPCRADIPHLKEVYKLYNPEGFNIVSISLDENKDSWQEAVKEEQMYWKQYIDTTAFNGDINKIYKVQGIPACFLIGPDGKIVTDNMRGSYMDKRLIKMYGNKFKK
ncbi:AhpC/TSA family protein [Cellulophaga sp. 20_2_10]|uniref:TlpA disulfide reductase family protein n=1 Tax=Cellulophaga sp. 20_2_10 TaxID=2942476 RepID=UPI00201A9026|nr:TlpA disulfide reductase family protein [Cellulophaga sp. 20_2_10]MCL5247205.1 AhpC/TSA family protein [Cellulophaga sp. 20_2_10]